MAPPRRPTFTPQDKTPRIQIPQYSRFKQAYPKDWVDVEKVWLEQRARWRPLLQEPARVVNPPTPPSPTQGAAEAADRSPGQDRDWTR